MSKVVDSIEDISRIDAIEASSGVTSVAGRTGDVTLAEADITDLDKYTQAEVTSLLAGKEDADTTILKDSDIGISVLAPNGDGSQLTGIDSGVEVTTTTKSFAENEELTVTTSEGIVESVRKEITSTSGQTLWYVDLNNYDMDKTVILDNGELGLEDEGASGDFANISLNGSKSGSLGGSSYKAFWYPHLTTSAYDGRGIHRVNGSEISYYNAQNYDISTLTTINTTYGLYLSGIITGSITDVAFSSDYSKMYIRDTGTSNIYQFSSTGTNYSNWMKNMTLDGQATISSLSTTATVMLLSKDGTKIYLFGQTSPYHNYYEEVTLSTPFDITTASSASNMSYMNTSLNGDNVDYIYDVFWDNEGTKIFLQTNQGVASFSLTTPYRLGYVGSAMTYDGIIYTIANSQRVAVNQWTTVNKKGCTELLANDYSSVTHSYSLGGYDYANYGVAISKDLSQIKTPFYTSVSSIAVTDTLKANTNIYFAYSTDGKQSFKRVTDAERIITKNNNGTWQVNTNADFYSETWINATENTMSGALKEACTYAINRATESLLEGNDTNTVVGDTFDMAVILHSDDNQVTPSLYEIINIIFSGYIRFVEAVNGTDYVIYTSEDSGKTDIVIKSNAEQNLKIKAR